MRQDAQFSAADVSPRTQPHFFADVNKTCAPALGKLRRMSTAASLLIALLALAVASASTPARASMPSDPNELLLRMDSDGDGRISREEYRAWLSRGFRAMDGNGDGVLQPEELPPGTQFRQRRALSLQQHHAQLDARFALQDSDGNGYLNARELSAPPQPPRNGR